MDVALANGSSSALPWVIAALAGVVAAGALGFMAGRYTAPESSAPAALGPEQAAAAQPPAQQTGTTSETIQDWTLVCQEPPGGRKTCFALQQENDAEGRLTMAVLAGYDANASRTVLVRVPLGVALDRGVEFKFGDKEAEAFAFGACNQVSCDAVLTISEAGFTQLNEAGSFELAYTSGDGVRVPANISMKGLPEAYAKIERPTPPPAPAPAESAPETPAPATP